jgi:pimeloyl-ACP methyl ester carboxylesterase
MTDPMTADVRQRSGGAGEPLLLLVHGMGATSDVWAGCEPVLANEWPGRWIAPDLPGHGGSTPLQRYTFDTLAASLAGLLKGSSEVVVLGHSLGGVVGLALADADPEQRVRGVVGLGIKTQWTDAELARARELAERPTAWFPSRDEAASRYLRVSGLAGLVPADDPRVDPGLSTQDGQWRLAMDPTVFAIGAPDMRGLLDRTPARVLLARGEHDPMVSDEHLSQLGTAVATLPGVGHNAHVEDPASVVRLCLGVR